MKSKINETTAPLFPERGATRPTKSTLLAQTQARLRDSAATEATRLEKRIFRGEAAVGKIVLNEPELFALVAPKLGPHLDKLGSARKLVDNYSANRVELEQLRKFF